MPGVCLDEADVAAWQFSVSLLVKVVRFLGTLHWPCGIGDLGIGGVSNLELLILYEVWAGERLVPEVAVPVGRRRGRPILVSAVPVGPGTNIGRSCMFLGSVIRTLRGMPGGLARFLPCRIGAHHCRLRHVGWEKCGHGLTSRPRETSEPTFLDSLLGVFGNPAGSGAVLLAGDLPLRYYSGSFVLRKPTWRLPQDGGVRTLVIGSSLPDDLGSNGLGICWTRGAGGFWKRVRLTKKTANSLVRRHGDLHALHGKRWKRLHVSGDVLGSGDRSVKRGRLTLSQHGDFPRVGVG